MGKVKLEWHTEKRKVSDLVPYKKNPRIISDKQMDDLKRSLKKFSLAELPCINLDGTLVAGNQRVLALSLLGRGNDEIEVRVPNRALSEKEFKDYLLTSNRSGGSWDWDMLAQDFDIETILASGFDDMDLSHIWDDSLTTEDTHRNIEKELKAIKKVYVKTGDIYQLGNHRLICGSNQDIEVVKKLMGSARADVMNTDVPYNVGISYDKGLGGKQNYGGKTNDKKSDAEYSQFIENVLTNAIAVSKDDAHFFIWGDEKKIGLLQSLYHKLGINEKRLCMWCKQNQNPTPAIAFNKIIEFCLYGTRGEPYISDKLKNLNEILNKEVSSGNRLHDDILDLFNIWMVKRLSGSEMEHPTQKPPTLYEKSLRRCSKPGDIILDLCGGSGALLLACEQLKRRAFLCEVEEVFCQLIINLYEQITKNKAKKLN